MTSEASEARETISSCEAGYIVSKKIFEKEEVLNLYAGIRTRLPAARAPSSKPFSDLRDSLIVLILIRKSLNSMRRHLVKMTERLPLYHDDDLISNHSATSPPLHGKDTTMDTMVGGLHDAEVVVHPEVLLPLISIDLTSWRRRNR